MTNITTKEEALKCFWDVRNICYLTHGMQFENTEKYLNKIKQFIESQPGSSKTWEKWEEIEKEFGKLSDENPFGLSIVQELSFFKQHFESLIAERDEWKRKFEELQK